MIEANFEMTVWNLNLDGMALMGQFQIPAMCTPRSLKEARQTSERKMTARDPSEALNIWVSKGRVRGNMWTTAICGQRAIRFKKKMRYY